MASITTYSGNTPHVVLGKEAASQTFKEGDLVYFDSDGLVAISTAGDIDGIARADASGTTSAEISVELIDLNAVYSCKYKASATAQTLVGALADFVFTVGAHTLDDSGASTDAYVVGIDARDTLTDSGGRLLFRFKPTVVA